MKLCRTYPECCPPSLVYSRYAAFVDAPQRPLDTKDLSLVNLLSGDFVILLHASELPILRRL